MLEIGSGFRPDGLHWPEFPQQMTPDEFLRDFGAFTYSITIDGDTKVWSFTVDELRRQFDRQIRDQRGGLFAEPKKQAAATSER